MPEDKYYNDTPEDERLNEEAEGAEVVDEAYEDQTAEEEDTDLDRLLDFLVETLTSAKSIPLNNNMRIVNLQMCMDIVEDIRNCLPDQIRMSSIIIDNRDRLLRDAKTSAESKIKAAESRANAAIGAANLQANEIVNKAEDRAADIVEKAETRARAMIDQSEITRLAHEEANQICEEARAKANEIRLEANNYAQAILETLEGDVTEALNVVQKSMARQKDDMLRENAARAIKD